jgi:hypothetical protein
MASGISEGLAKIGAKRRETPTVAAKYLFFPKRDDKHWGHLWHPRSELPLSDELVDDIVESGEVREDILIWEQRAHGGEITQGGIRLKQGDVLLIVGDGSRRSRGSLVAEGRLHASGKLDKKRDFHVPVRKFRPTSHQTAVMEFLLARQSYQSERLKEAHTPSVIAQIFCAATKYGATVDELQASAPKEYTSKVIECMLEWHSLLSAEAAEAFDRGLDGKAVPIIFLPAIMRLPHPEQLPKLRLLMESEVTSVQGASRYLNTAARRQALQESLDGEPHAADNPGAAAQAGANGAGKRRRSPIARSGLSHQHMRELFLRLEDRSLSKHARAFVLGAKLDRGEEVDCDGLTKDAAAMVDGLIFSRSASVSKDVPEEVLAVVKEVVEEANARAKAKAEEVKARKAKQEAKQQAKVNGGKAVAKETPEEDVEDAEDLEDEEDDEEEDDDEE